jgi:hypothetical protein
LKRADYQREWGKQYQRPGIGARVLAFLFKLVPKVGPFKAISFQMPTTQTENLFVGGVDQTVDHFRAYLRQAGEGSLTLPNRDFDTGAPTSFGEYRLTDESYGKLLDKVAGNNFSNVDAALQQNIIQFYAAAQPPPSKKERERWAKLQSELERLRNFRGESQPTAASRP